MRPAARVQTAIELLDAIAAGQPAEQALTRWARTSRFAGSKDRAAVRDHVFDVLRMWRSTARLGGGESGRARMLGLLRLQEAPLEEIFSGAPHAPAPLDAEEKASGAALSPEEARDLPDWLWPFFTDGVDISQAEADAAALRSRAPLDLRINLMKTTRDDARAGLAEDGVIAEPVPLCATALRVTEGARRVSATQAFRDGHVELQDAASQAVVAALPLRTGHRVLDFCAGGGGKSLAMAAITGGEIVAHDADPRRMRDLPQRAARAGAHVAPTKELKGLFDLVLCDVPCSGSGSWRRAPEAKWRLTETRLKALFTLQAEILTKAAGNVAPGGHLAYATCSLLKRENADQVAAFLAAQPGYLLTHERQFRLTDGGDGFYVAVLTRG